MYKILTSIANITTTGCSSYHISLLLVVYYVLVVLLDTGINIAMPLPSGVCPVCPGLYVSR